MEGRLMIGSHLPAGFRFHPTDQELITCYMSKKITSSIPPEWDIIADIDLYKFNPWELPDQKAFFGEREWFFFSPRDRKYPNGVRPNRAAASGYWKATGTDKPILASGGTQCIGVKKALVFYIGRPPKGTKTEWVMQEYRLLDSMTSASQSQKQKGSMRLDDWVLCRVRQKGNFPAASDEMAETCSPPVSSVFHNPQNKEKQNVVMNRTSGLTEWCDSQLLSYPMESYEGREDSDPAYYMRCSNLGTAGGNFVETQQRPSTQTIALSFGFTKRKLSFGELDELMLIQPGKRLQCSADELVSPAESISVNQDFPNFFI